jgi:G:T/U-mismatch repair DNA glycosylase
MRTLPSSVFPKNLARVKNKAGKGEFDMKGQPDWKPETHPNWYKDVPKMKCLILGSFPPHELKRHYPFYYPNSTNRFWNILAKIAKKELTYSKKLTEKEKLKAVEERYEIMRLLNIGVQNIGLEIKRKNNSADDNNIQIEKFQDILSIVKKHHELEKILLPGYSAPNSTTKAFLKYLKSKNIPYKVKEIKPNAEFFINIFNRKIKCVILNSTSRRAGRVTEDELLKQFKKHLT